jgi:hypothetical protein
LLAIALIGLGIGAHLRSSRGSTHYLFGWWDAEREHWIGNATIYEVCLPMYAGSDNLDRGTGLPILRCFGGYCSLADYDIDARTRGHNDCITNYIRWHGLPANTLRPWEDQLYNLRRFFEEHSRTEAPKPLRANGSTVVSPDGLNSVRVLSYPQGQPVPGGRLWLAITAGRVTLNRCCVRFVRGESDLLWGPKGSRVVVIRSISESEEKYSAFDLRTGLHLRDESWYGTRLREFETLRCIPKRLVPASGTVSTSLRRPIENPLNVCESLGRRPDAVAHDRGGRPCSDRKSRSNSSKGRVRPASTSASPC